MLALLKLIPIKDYVYGAIIIALLVGFGLFIHHEREVGAASLKAADAKAVAAQVAANAKVEANETASLGIAVTTYTKSIAAPVTDVPRIVCRASSQGGAVSDHGGASGSGHGSPVVPSESTVPFDPAPGILANDRDADAQVTLLQVYVKACQTAGICKK